MRPTIIAVLECPTPPSHLVYSARPFSDTGCFFISTGFLFTNFFKMPAEDTLRVQKSAAAIPSMKSTWFEPIIHTQ